MTENMKRLMAEAGKDAAFAEKLAAAEAPEDLMALAAEKGVALTAEDLQASPAGELDDEELDNVSGGLLIEQLLGRFLFRRPKAARTVCRMDGARPQADNLVYNYGAKPQASNLVYHFGTVPQAGTLGAVLPDEGNDIGKM